MAGVAVGGKNGRRLKVENPIAGLIACGAAWMFERIVESEDAIERTRLAHILPNIDVTSD